MKLKLFLLKVFYLLGLFRVLLNISGGGVVVYGFIFENIQLFIIFLLIAVYWIISRFIVLNLFFILCLLLFLAFCFLVKDFFWFYIKFELSILPIFFLVVLGGSNPERLNAAVLMLVYTLVGGVPLLVSIILINFEFFSLNFFILNLTRISFRNIFNIKLFILIFFVLRFMIKVPLFGFHFWLPLVHVESPVEGSMILAAVMIKMGSYGLYRLSFINFLFIKYFFVMFFCWVLVGKVILSLLIYRLVDYKRIVAFSSVIHMSLSFLCILNLSFIRFLGLFLLITSHGLVRRGLFYYGGFMYNITNSRSILINKGFNFFCFSVVFLFCLFLFKMSFPPFISFIREYFLFRSVIVLKWNFVVAIIIVFLVVGFYKIYLFRLISFGKGYTGFVYKLNNQMINLKGLLFHLGVYFCLFFCLNLLF